MITSSETLNELFTALGKAQGEMKHAAKDQANPFFNSRYADLAGILDVCREPLHKHGLCVLQMPGLVEPGDVISLATRLGHTSGQWIQSVAVAKPAKLDPQGIGSCITYLRRYSLSAVLGIAQDDDDGNAASTATPPPEQKPSLGPIQPFGVRKVAETLNDSQQAQILTLIDDIYPDTIGEEGGELLKAVLAKCHVTRLEDITVALYERTLTWIEKHRGQANG